MAYESRRVRRQRVRFSSDNEDNPLVFQLVVNGAKLTPDAASGVIAIYAPAGTTALVTATGGATISETKVLYSVDTTDEDDYPLGEGYRADIQVDVDGTTYTRHLMFDVVTYLFDFGFGFDQLVAIDDTIRGMGWDGDDDMSEVIASCCDRLQARIESKILNSGRLLQENILDPSRLTQPAMLYTLAHIFRVKSPEKAESYRKESDDLWDAVLSTIQFDTGQGGAEDAEIGGIQEVRLQT